jgi:hypothetical protein
MLALFCLRLAIGLMACLLLLSPKQVNPRFYRTHFLTALGLALGALVLSWSTAGTWLAIVLTVAVLTAFVGSIVWSLEGTPAGLPLIVLTMALLAASLVLMEQSYAELEDARAYARLALGWRLAGDFASAGLLGAATTAMLIGHSYLIAPAMSLTPLFRLLGALAVATVLRMALGTVGFGMWSRSGETLAFGDVAVWLPVRWALGFIGPLVLGWMAWRTARMRSTQSATGILYVVVIFCFLGELTGQILMFATGFML